METVLAQAKGSVDATRRLFVAPECGSVGAFVGEKVARQRDEAHGGLRMKGEALLKLLIRNYKLAASEHSYAREGLAGFCDFVRSGDGGFEAFVRHLRSEFGEFAPITRNPL